MQRLHLAKLPLLAWVLLGHLHQVFLNKAQAKVYNVRFNAFPVNRNLAHDDKKAIHVLKLQRNRIKDKYIHDIIFASVPPYDRLEDA